MSKFAGPSRDLRYTIIQSPNWPRHTRSLLCNFSINVVVVFDNRKCYRFRPVGGEIREISTQWSCPPIRLAAKESNLFQYAQTNIQLYEQLASDGYSSLELKRIRDCYELAARLFSGQYRANGKPFIAHLVGTASILARHGASAPVVCAGLVHAAYDRGEFGTLWSRIMTPGKRRLVRSVIGDDAEALAARYVAFTWNSETVDSLSNKISELSEEERAIVFMRLANELEEVAYRDLLYDCEIRRCERLGCLSSCFDIARALGQPELANEIQERCREIQTLHVADSLLSQNLASYTLSPLSHGRRILPALEHGLRLVWRRFPDNLRLRVVIWANTRLIGKE